MLTNEQLCEQYRKQIRAHLARTNKLTAKINHPTNDLTPAQIESMQAECEQAWQHIQSLRAQLIQRGINLPTA